MSDNICLVYAVNRDAREFLEAMCVINNTAEDHEMSLLFFLWYLRQGKGVHRIWSIKDGAQQRKIIGGSQQLSIKIAKKLGGIYNYFLSLQCIQCSFSLSMTFLTRGLWQITLLNFSERVHKKKAVVQIRHTDDGVMVKTLDGAVFNGSYVIMAIPPPTHVNTDFSFIGATDYLSDPKFKSLGPKLNGFPVHCY